MPLGVWGPEPLNKLNRLCKNDLKKMVTFKLNEEAEDDLERLYEHGILCFGLAQADLYYDGLIEHFYKLAKNPYLWQAVDSIRIGYRRGVYVSDSIYYRIAGGTTVCKCNIAGILFHDGSPNFTV